MMFGKFCLTQKGEDHLMEDGVLITSDPAERIALVGEDENGLDLVREGHHVIVYPEGSISTTNQDSWYNDEGREAVLETLKDWGYLI